ncbi:hypothetical protein ADUPG1_008230, partial [Aduncisulcus paluster]
MTFPYFRLLDQCGSSSSCCHDPSGKVTFSRSSPFSSTNITKTPHMPCSDHVSPHSLGDTFMMSPMASLPTLFMILFLVIPCLSCTQRIQTGLSIFILLTTIFFAFSSTSKTSKRPFSSHSTCYEWSCN